MPAIEVYEERVGTARGRLAGLEALRFATGSDADPDLLERFLIHFCALGVGMTAPVEGWIRRAGERCEATGHPELGRALRAHAKHEAGHDALFQADRDALLARRVAKGRRALDAAAVRAIRQTPGVERYASLHERVIASDAPFGQLAIEYEIEALSVRHGPALLGNCAKILGPDVLGCLTFAQEHVELDQGHTRFNREQLDSLLRERPSALDPLVEAGSSALDAYGAYLTDCLRLARAS